MLANWSVGLTIKTASNVQVRDEHSTFSGCLNPLCGDSNKRYSPRLRVPRLNLPSASVDSFLTLSCLDSEMKRLSSMGEFLSGAFVWSVTRPCTVASAVRTRFGCSGSTDAQYSGLPSDGPLFPSCPTTTTWPCPVAINNTNCTDAAVKRYF